jgi:1,2-phenylacetyl-CoA epoxidase PaaB subunit
MQRKEQPSLRWDIYLARSTPAKLIGSVKAPDADAAVEAAIRDFGIKGEHAKRLIAVRRG